MTPFHILSLHLVLLALGWMACARFFAQNNRAPRLWAAYCFLHAAPALLWFVPPLWAGVFSAALSMLGYMAATAGVSVFVSGLYSDRKWQATVVLTCVSVGVIANFLPIPPESQRTIRVLALFGGIVIIVLGAMPSLWKLLRSKFSRLTTALCLAPNIIAGGFQLAVLVWSVTVGPLSKSFDPQQVQLTAVVVGTIATVMFNLCFAFLFVESLTTSLKHSAEHDHLTGLANRRSCVSRMSTAFDLHKRTSVGLAVLMVDIDFFKKVNDEHGHAGGDAALVFASNCLTRSCRSQDIVGRWGGEEFIVVLTGVTPEDVTLTAERIRRTLESEAFAILKHTLTASIGTSSARSSDKSIDDVVARADSCLYTAKRGGRNRVEVDLIDVKRLPHEPHPHPEANPA